MKQQMTGPINPAGICKRTSGSQETKPEDD